jgi:hypothetical protein
MFLGPIAAGREIHSRLEHRGWGDEDDVDVFLVGDGVGAIGGGEVVEDPVEVGSEVWDGDVLTCLAGEGGVVGSCLSVGAQHFWFYFSTNGFQRHEVEVEGEIVIQRTIPNSHEPDLARAPLLGLVFSRKDLVDEWDGSVVQISS